MNSQKPEPRAKGDGDVLDVHSIFFTIQGEGPFAGHRAVFLRLAGCNLQCPGCDTEYTEGRKPMGIFDIEHSIRRAASAENAGRALLVVITGGEPLRQVIGPLCQLLTSKGYKIQIESNGVFEPDQKLLALLLLNREAVQLVVSPKTKSVHQTTARVAAAFKYVLDHRSVDTEDGLPIRALEHPSATRIARPWDYNVSVPVYLNPFDAQDEEHNKLNRDAVAASCMKHGHILGLQLHKLLNLA
jgi:7-carboxy-7-deazaguanine synthase